MEFIYSGDHGPRSCPGYVHSGEKCYV